MLPTRATHWFAPFPEARPRGSVWRKHCSMIRTICCWTNPSPAWTGPQSKVSPTSSPSPAERHYFSPMTKSKVAPCAGPPHSFQRQGRNKLNRILSLAARDLLSETRARQIAPVMILFALSLVLSFTFTMLTGALRAPVPLPQAGAVAAREITGTLLWATIFLSTIIGLGRGVAVDRESGAGEGLLLAPSIQRPCSPPSWWQTWPFSPPPKSW